MFHSYVMVADKKTQETANDAQASDKEPVQAAGTVIGLFSSAHLGPS